MRKRGSYWVPVLIGLVFLVGCQSTGKREVHRYVLGLEGTRVGIKDAIAIRLPDYLYTSSVVVETESGEIRPASFHVWSEPLAFGVQRVLSEALETRLEFEESERLLVEVSTFHGNMKGVVRFTGEWTIVGKETVVYSIELQQSQPGYAALVDAHEACVRALATEIAQALGTE